MKLDFFKILVPSFFVTFSVSAADSTIVKKKFHNEIGIDASNTIFLIRKSEDLYLINYKRHFTKSALRSGINLKWESEISGSKTIDYRLGYEWKKAIKKWEFFYGFDLSFSYTQYNLQKNTISQYGANPLIGFRYYFSPRFSISTEPHLNMKYIVNRDPQSFDKSANSENYKIGLGAIGLVLVNFHF